jgi:hypothetical protein
MVVVDEIKYIIDTMRERGIFTKTSNVKPNSVPCNVVYDCNPCLAFEDLENGVYGWYNLEPYYYYGNKNEIERLLDFKGKAFNQENRIKYPAIILEQPFREVPTNGFNKCTLRILIVTGSNSTDTYEQRYNNSFKTILYPLHDSLISAFKKASNVASYEVLDKTDRPFFTEAALVSSDYWDVIDLRIETTLINNCKTNILCQY